MKTVVKALVLLCLSSLSLRAGDFATEMLDATFKLFNAASTATCFLVRADAPAQTLYLATAAHVLEKSKGETAILVLRERSADGSYQRRDWTIAIRQGEKPLWVRHEKEDAAVLALPEPLPVSVGALPLSALANEEKLTAYGLHICSPLFVLTYPRRFEANPAGFAVARQAIVASHPFLPIQRHPTFLADFTTFAGDSGGPVFVPGDENHPLLVGITLAQYRHDEKVAMETQEVTIHHPLGLATILHAEAIRATIELAQREHSETQTTAPKGEAPKPEPAQEPAE